MAEQGIPYGAVRPGWRGALASVVCAAALLGRHTALLPLLVFVVAGVLTSLGAVGPAAVAVVAPIALRFAATI